MAAKADCILFGAGVYVACGFVEYEHGRLGEHDAGNAQKLFFALTYRTAFVVYHGVVAVFELLYKRVYVSAFRRVFYFFAGGVRFAVSNVFGNRAAENPTVLQHHAVRAAQAVTGNLGYGRVREQYAPRLRVVKAHEQIY